MMRSAAASVAFQLGLSQSACGSVPAIAEVKLKASNLRSASLGEVQGLTCAPASLQRLAAQ